MIDGSGATQTYTNSYTELASGMHFLDEKNTWQNTVAEFVSVDGGFVANRGPHQVALATDLSVAGAVTIVTSDGQTLRNTPTMLAYVDRVTGKGVPLATLQPTRGELIAPNTVQWSAAFGDLGDVVATYTVGGFECDVILRQQLPSPAALGLNPETTDITVYTEFFDTQPSTQGVVDLPAEGTDKLTDWRLDFGTMVMDRGRAFGLDVNGTADSRPRSDVSVRKSWELIEGRTFLLEKTQFRALAPLLKELPEATSPSPANRDFNERAKRTAGLDLPARPKVHGGWPTGTTGRLLAVALPVRARGNRSGTVAVSRNRPGVVLDYTIVNTNPNVTFDGQITYYVTGPVNLTGNVTFKAGTVIKYDNANSPSLNVLSGATLSWLGAPYQPVVMTSKDDISVGEVLPGTTGSPTGYYAASALTLNSLGVVMLPNICVRNANCGVVATGGSRPTVRHGQFINCGTAVKTEYTSLLQNVLFNNVANVVWSAGIYPSAAEHITVDVANYLNYQSSTGSLTITNSVYVNVSSASGTSFVNSYLATPAQAGFVTVGAGGHYIDSVNGWFASNQADPAKVSPDLAAELTKTTSEPPLLISGSQVNNRQLSALVARDPIFVGYTYWPIDYIFNNATVGNATVMLGSGVVAAFWGSNANGIQLQSGAKFVSIGRPEALNRLCRSAAVQEQATGGSTSSTRALFDVASAASLPELRLQYTQADLCADGASRRYLLNSVNPAAVVNIRDCQFSNVGVAMAPAASATSQLCSLFNNVWRNSSVRAYRYYNTSFTVNSRNNYFQNGDFLLYDSAASGYPTWTCTDNLFENTSISQYFPSNFPITGYNGYTSSTAALGGSNNKTSLTLDWIAGPLGPWYYPDSGSGLFQLRDTGSQFANTAGLYHYTTQYGQQKEQFSKVDIGFHYSPCYVSGSIPCDTDQDGVADVVEDANGNGIADPNEFNWQIYDTDGDGLRDELEMAAVANFGEVLSWGSLGSATDDQANLPALTSYIAVSAGAAHNVGLRQNGTAFAWGSAGGVGATTVPSTAVNLVAISAGNAFSLGLKETGEIVAWGDTAFGKSTPPSPNIDFIAIAGGYDHALGLKKNNTVVAWGNNASGQANVPSGLVNVIAIAAGQNHSLALKSDGTVVAWGANNLGQTSIPGNATGIVEIAAGYTHNLALRSDGQVVAWGDNTGGAATVPAGLNNVLHVAAGNHFSVAMKNDYTLVGWGDNANGQISFPTSANNLQAIACGPSRTVALPYTPVLSYPVNMRRDFLIIFNSNLPDSWSMLNYYQNNRRFAGLATCLQIGLSNSLDETLSQGVYASTFLPAIQNWYNTNPTKRPAYILLMYGVPNNPSPFLVGSPPLPVPPGTPSSKPQGGSLQNDLRESLRSAYGRRPYLSALNFNLTTDCTHYIDKLKLVGDANPLNCVILSADKAGTNRDTYVLDNVKILYTPFNNNPVISDARNLLNNIVVSPQTILYRSSNPGSDQPVTSAANIYCYLSWGKYNFTNSAATWSTVPAVTFSGNSSWYALETIESVNGEWIPQQGQQSYVKWFSQQAFGGSNWERTPITATSTVYEPGTTGIAQPKDWLPLWATGHSSSVCFWVAKPAMPESGTHNPNYIQVTGDPLVSK